MAMGIKGIAWWGIITKIPVTRITVVGLHLQQNVAMLDKILQGTLDTPKIAVLFTQGTFCKITQPCYNLARDPC